MSKKKVAAKPKKESKASATGKGQLPKDSDAIDAGTGENLPVADNVAKIGDNSGVNIVKQAVADILELRKEKKELNAAERGIKADVKANGIAIKAFNHVLSVASMEEETAANFLQDTRILFEALDMQGAFDFTDGEEKPDAADPLEAAKAEANA